MSKVRNDYLVANFVDGHDLLVVQLQDGGWSIADGQGTLITPKDEIEFAGWHLPIKFDSEEQAVKAIKSGPHAMFDIVADSVWSQHALNCGGTRVHSYEM